MATPGAKIIKGLASCNTKIRSKSLITLLNWLPSQTLISDDFMKKLWKSLFYCMWHCDKIQNQTHLINQLSNLFPSLNFSISVSYFSQFLVTMRREWPGIDHLRLDKFYLLIRFFVRHLFVLMKNNKWDLRVLECFVEILEKNAFLVDNDVDDKGLGNGVTYHVVSVFCEELKPFLPVKFEVLNLLFRPFVDVMGKSKNKVLLGKVKNHVFDYLIKNGKGLLEVRKSGEEVEENDVRVLFGTMAFVMGFSTRFYELGSDPICIQGNRKVVFGLHDEFLKLEKEKISLGIDVSLPEVIEGLDDEHVPHLAPVNGEKKVDGESKGSKEKKSKKKKKKKKKNGVVDQAEPSGIDANGDSDMVNSNDDSPNVELEENVEEVVLSEAAISNLQKQFEKIAAESGLDGDGVSALDSPPTVYVNGKTMKKRKRTKAAVNAEAETGAKEEAEEESALKTEEKSNVKKVKFSMKNNLVWKPHSPLPPQSLRIPPSVTPRGSALKKGLSPGPIRDMSQEAKKAKKKKASPLKKARKLKSISPAVKRVRKVKATSA